MADHSTCNWTGASGIEYTYYLWPLPADFSPDQNGNYIFSKKNAEGKWVPVYIGEGDLADRVTDSHHQVSCIQNKSATHVHVHLNDNDKARKAEEADLLARYTNACKPGGCNEKIGG